MIAISNELRTTKQAKSYIKKALNRFKYVPKIDVGFDFIKISNKKCTHFVYINSCDLENTLVELNIKNYDLLCLRFCEVV